VIKLQSVSREARWQNSLLCGLLRRLYWEALEGGRSECKTCSGWFKILLNNCLSDVEHRVAKSSVSLSQKPDRLLLLRNACSFCRSVALVKPTQELRVQQLNEHHRSIDTIMYPCARKTLKAYKVCAQDDMTAWMWSETGRPFVTVTPRIFNTPTR